jgi:hypothetical protein
MLLSQNFSFGKVTLDFALLSYLSVELVPKTEVLEQPQLFWLCITDDQKITGE